MKITRRDLLVAIGAGSAAAVPHALRGQHLGLLSSTFVDTQQATKYGGSGDANTLPLDKTLNATPAWSLDLSGTWRIAKDPDNSGKDAGWFKKGPVSEAVEQKLPNPLELAFPGYDGVVWYWRTFKVTNVHSFDDLRIHFQGADYYAEAWLNGQYVGGNQSALLPFAFDVKEAIREGSNDLVVRVIDACYAKEIDGFQLGHVPGGRQHDNPFEPGFRHYNYGGLLLPVALQAFHRPWIADAFIQPDIHEGKIHIDLALVGDGDGSWSATVRPHKGVGKATATTVSLRPDSSGNASISLIISDPHLWDVWDGFLYEVELTPKAKGTSWRGRFGMREVSILDGRLAVNGKQILQRSYLYNQIWPVTLGAPYQDLARRDIELVRQTNANMLRCFSKTPLLATIEAADEAGILLQHESLGSWYLKNGTAEDERLINITKRAVLAYRNHPSIFWWNILNENAPAFDPKRAYPADEFTLGPYVLQHALGEVHQLDPTRPVIANDPIWHQVDNVWEPGHAAPSLPLIQDHYYQFTGLENNEESWANIRHRKWGEPDSPTAPYLAVTEWGVNASPVWSRLMQSYKDSGVREDADDYVVYRKLRDMNLHWYENSGVQHQGFPTLDSIGEANREYVVWRHREQMALYWGNLHSAGHGLTSLEDSSYEQSGIVDNWRNPKPAVFENITDLNRPLQINLWLRPSSLYSGNELGFDATLVNERQRLPQGDCIVKLQLLDSEGKSVFSKEYSHTIADQPIEHLVTDSTVIRQKAGAYRLIAELAHAGQHLHAERPVVVFERKPVEIKFDRKVWIWERNGTLRTWLTTRSLSPVDRGDASAVRAGDLMVIMQADRSQLPAIQAAIRQGARAVILCPEKVLVDEKPTTAGGVEVYSDLLDPLIKNWKPELRKIDWWGAPSAWGYTRTALALRHPFLDGLPQAKAFEAQPVYQRIAPQFTWLMNDQPQDIQISHAVMESSLAVDIPYTSDLFSVPVGQGILILTSLRIGDYLGIDPASDKVLENILLAITKE